MKTKAYKVKDLKRADYNPRTISERQREDLKASITKFGMVDPIVVNKSKERKGLVISGHQRLDIWEELGHETIPAIEVELSLEDEKELNIRFNKNKGEFDIELLNEHFTSEELSEYGFQEYDYANEEYDLSILDEETEDEEPKEPKKKRLVLQIEFTKDYYEEARELHKDLLANSIDVGKLFIKKLKKYT